MSLKLLSRLLMFSVVLVLASSCTEAPQQEIDAAKAALEAARTAEADRYVADEYNAARDSLDAALAFVEKQNERIGLLRNYEGAKQMLAAVTSMANDVRDNALVRKDEIRLEVQQALAEVTAALQEANQLIAAAPAGKESRAALATMQSELTVVETSMTEVSTLMSGGDYLTALDKVNAGKEKVQSINTELREANAKRSTTQKKASL